MYMLAAKRCLKYWLRLLKMSGHRYVKICYDMLVHYDNIGYNNWVSDIRVHLYQNGFGYIWERREDFNHKLFLLEYVQRLKDHYIQLWKSKCIESSKLFHYSNYKLTYGVASYVNIVDLDTFRRCLTSFRGSSHELMIEQGYLKSIVLVHIVEEV